MKSKVLAFVWSAVMLTSSLAAADVGYLTVTGSKMGVLKGSAVNKGYEATIPVISLQHSIMQARDPSILQATGRRVLRPLVIRKDPDRSTPLLLQALANNERLSTVVLRLTMPSKTGGALTTYCTIKLTNAAISSVETSTKGADTATPRLEEEVTFSYQKIEVTWHEGNIVYSDGYDP